MHTYLFYAVDMEEMHYFQLQRPILEELFILSCVIHCQFSCVPWCVYCCLFNTI